MLFELPNDFFKRPIRSTIRNTPATPANTPATPIKTQEKLINTQGYFSTQPESIENCWSLLEKLDKFQSISTNGDTISKNSLLEKTLTDIYTAIDSGVAIPSNFTELKSVFTARFKKVIENTPDDDFTLINDFAKGMLADLEKSADKPEVFNDLKNKLNAVFKKDPHLLFEKAANYPETVRRLVKVLDLPTQNDKGWNLTSQAAKAGNPKLANAFETAGFGPNLHHKAMVDFAKAMTDDAPNADKSKALKELMGVTSLS